MLIFKIESTYRSQRLIENSKVAARITGSAATLRYMALGVGLIGLMPNGIEPNMVADSLFVVLGVAVHNFAYKYFGFGFSLPKLKSPNEYVPLSRWVIPDADQPLTHAECHEVASRLSPVARDKLGEVMEYFGIVTVFDAVNLAMLDVQCSNN